MDSYLSQRLLDAYIKQLEKAQTFKEYKATQIRYIKTLRESYTISIDISDSYADPGACELHRRLEQLINDFERLP